MKPETNLKEEKMIANEENSARAYETTPEEVGLLERSSLPTLRDLQAAAKDLFTTIVAEPDSALSDVNSPCQSTSTV
jgi:hypothetical protein